MIMKMMPTLVNCKCSYIMILNEESCEVIDKDLMCIMFYSNEWLNFFYVISIMYSDGQSSVTRKEGTWTARNN